MGIVDDVGRAIGGKAIRGPYNATAEEYGYRRNVKKKTNCRTAELAFSDGELSKWKA